MDKIQLGVPAAEEGSTQPDASASQPGQSVPDEGLVEFKERPQWVPEKFYKDGKVNMKAMAASYAESEAARTKESQAAQPKDGEQPKTGEQPKEGEQAPIVVPGVAPERMTHFSEEIVKGGKLSDESYEELAKLGYGKAVVDAYVKGLMPQADPQATADAAVEAAKQGQAIKDSIGGDQVFADMIAWAQTNLSDADLETYNKAVAGTDVNKSKLAVQGLFHAYEQANGKPPSYLEGRERFHVTGVKPFLSNEQVVEAMRDSRYDRDQAYRDEVAQRLAISDVFGQSRVTK